LLANEQTSDEEDLFVTWWIKGRSKVEITRSKYWVHHRLNKSDELSSTGVVRAIDLNSERFRTFYAGK